MTAFLYDLIFTIPSCISFTVLAQNFGQEETSSLSFPIAILFGCLCIVFYHIKTKSRILLGGIIATLLLGYLVIAGTETLLSNLWVFQILLITILCFVFVRIMSKYIRIKAISALLLLGVLITMMITGVQITKAVFILMLFFLLACLVDLIQAGWKKEGHTDAKKHVVYTLPFLLPLILLLIFLKIPDHPYDWKFVKELISDVRTGYEVLIQTFLPDQGWDGDNNMGFSDKAYINGSIEDDPYRVMSVSTGEDHDYRLYLGGKTFDTFDGRQWIKQDDSAIDYRTLDRYELIAAILQNDPDNPDDYFQNVRIRIEYDGIRTQHVFAPMKAVMDMPAYPTSQSGGDLLLDGRKKAEYVVKYYRINKDHPKFRTLLEHDDGITRQAWETAVEKNKGIIREDCTFEAYQKYRASVVENYGEKTVLSERARSFLDDLLSGAQSDPEKLERIETYLSAMTYSRTPGELPDHVQTDTDFIDYFLFEKQEGFCTHFATAFVLLARAEGIPARYVQGYSVLSEAKNFSIQSDRAHAWCEAYFDGIGWVGFEPTPGFKQQVIWASKEEGAHTSLDAALSKKAEEEQESSLSEETEEKGTFRWNLILIPLYCCLGFLLLYILIDRMIRKNRYRNMNEREKIITLCRSDIKLFKWIGLKIDPKETLTEFQNRIKKRVPGEILSFIPVYEEALYSDRTEYAKEVTDLEDLSKKCRRFIVKQWQQKLKIFSGPSRSARKDP